MVLRRGGSETECGLEQARGTRWKGRPSGSAVPSRARAGVRTAEGFAVLWSARSDAQSADPLLFTNVVLL